MEGTTALTRAKVRSTSKWRRDNIIIINVKADVVVDAKRRVSGLNKTNT